MLTDHSEELATLLAFQEARSWLTQVLEQAFFSDDKPACSLRGCWVSVRLIDELADS